MIFQYYSMIFQWYSMNFWYEFFLKCQKLWLNSCNREKNSSMVFCFFFCQLLFLSIFVCKRSQKWWLKWNKTQQQDHTTLLYFFSNEFFFSSTKNTFNLTGEGFFIPKFTQKIFGVNSINCTAPCLFSTLF